MMFCGYLLGSFCVSLSAEDMGALEQLCGSCGQDDETKKKKVAPKGKAKSKGKAKAKVTPKPKAKGEKKQPKKTVKKTGTSKEGKSAKRKDVASKPVEVQEGAEEEDPEEDDEMEDEEDKDEEEESLQVMKRPSMVTRDRRPAVPPPEEVDVLKPKAEVADASKSKMDEFEVPAIPAKRIRREDTQALESQVSGWYLDLFLIPFQSTFQFFQTSFGSCSIPCVCNPWCLYIGLCEVLWHATSWVGCGGVAASTQCIAAGRGRFPSTYLEVVWRS